MRHVRTQIVGTITKVHPPANYRYAWYTITTPDNKRHYCYVWNIPNVWEVVKED